MPDIDITTALSLLLDSASPRASIILTSAIKEIEELRAKLQLTTERKEELLDKFNTLTQALDEKIREGSTR